MQTAQRLLNIILIIRILYSYGLQLTPLQYSYSRNRLAACARKSKNPIENNHAVYQDYPENKK
jgi:hypothetical protein